MKKISSEFQRNFFCVSEFLNRNVARQSFRSIFKKKNTSLRWKYVAVLEVTWYFYFKFYSSVHITYCTMQDACSIYTNGFRLFGSFCVLVWDVYVWVFRLQWHARIRHIFHNIHMRKKLYRNTIWVWFILMFAWWYTFFSSSNVKLVHSFYV